MSKENKLIEIIAEILESEIEDVSLETKLDSSTWDSLAIVSFMAEADSEFGKSLSPTDVGSANTVADLFNLI